MNAADDKETQNKSRPSFTEGCLDNKKSSHCPSGISTTSKVNGNSEHNGSFSGDLPSHLDCNGTSTGAKPKVKTACNTPTRQRVNNNYTSFDKLQNGNMDIYLRNNVDNSTKCQDYGNVHWDSSTDEEEEECCFYTYKGDCNQMADLPSSFFRLDTNASRGNASRSSSPDMDYLEMDFDPGPSNERDSPSMSDSDCFEVTQNRSTLAESQDVDVAETSKKLSLDNVEASPVAEDSHHEGLPMEVEPSTSGLREQECQHDNKLSSQDTTVVMSTPSPVKSKEDIECESATSVNLPYIDDNHSLLDNGQQSSLSEIVTHGDSPIERVMLWSDAEASVKQVNQIAVSACGVTAVVNVLLALNLSFTLDKAKEAVGVRLRKNSAPVPEYLFSRCNAGATHEDMIHGLDVISQGCLYSRFFPMYPLRSFSLSRWLAYWMRRGAVPIATVNLQRGVHQGNQLPDFWHHQMIFGVGPSGIYLTNPLECVNEDILMPMLCSPPVLKVRAKDVIDRWTPDTNLRPLMYHSDPSWKRLNVLGQVVNVIRTSQRFNSSSVASHITIPASYTSGITLVIPRENPGFHDLKFAPDLPIVHNNASSSI